MKHLGEYLDIHCGGIDNAFPHHTNEIAQSEAYVGHKWCNYWFHVHHLNTNAGKMSKSSGEFLTVSLLESKGYNPLVYRLFCLQSHYRKSLVFSYENLDNAVIAYNKIVAKLVSLMKEEQGEIDSAAFDERRAAFSAALDNDMNTALAVTAVYDVLKAKTTPATKLALIKDFDRVLGLDLCEAAERIVEDEKRAAEEAAADPFVAEIEKLIAERAAAKKAKDYARADEIRNELSAKGVTLIDTPQGTKFTIA
jgi:cysteinyl-tRNA synthetase